MVQERAESKGFKILLPSSVETGRTECFRTSTPKMVEKRLFNTDPGCLFFVTGLFFFFYLDDLIVHEGSDPLQEFNP